MGSRVSQIEFVALMAMMVATVAFSIDSMLPALPEIAEGLTPLDPNKAQFIIAGFIVGMGSGTLVTGPLSDTFGRKPVVVAFTGLYLVGALAAWAAGSLELLVLARFVQGLGAAGPRVVSQAIIRDLYSGRQMARIVSFVMIVFTVFPAMAPFIGAFIIDLGGWRSIFIAFLFFGTISVLWFSIRLPEPLPVDRRRPFRPGELILALREMMAIPMVRLSILVQTLIFSILFSMISLIQPVFDVTFDKAEQFPVIFFSIGMFCATSSMVNAALVMRLGMRLLITIALSCYMVFCAVILILTLMDIPAGIYFWCFLAWQTATFYQMGLTIGNLNALAMEPLGHIAGLAASVMGAISTVGAGIVALLVGQTFDGTTLPLVLAALVLSLLALPPLLKMRQLDRSKTP
ncbi:multidrug effflux MFS transporter [Pseudooceanicola aestuarii]|uniref:multidrug effflux MFS transporter n=1 Tax=Pseudooceanicola aestuarii TaxID=2697319 RepID=UPI0013D7976C|nr:multidrug effflux MFS transporter [Pseudooceanicola aestuarii]